MQRMFLVLAVSAAALTSFATPNVEAAPRKKVDPTQCFETHRMTKWASEDGRQIYVRLNTGEVFQVTLAGRCPGITTYRTLAFETDFNDRICNGQAATIITRSGAGPLHCPVKSVRALSADEANALPDKQRP